MMEPFVIFVFLLGLFFGIFVAAAGLVLKERRSTKHSNDDEREPLLRPPLQSEPRSSSTASTLVQDLDPFKFEIRLMRLRGGAADTRIKCSLEIQSLDPAADVPPYEALSYVWADIPGMATLLVDGAEQTVTGNLALALTHLRYKDRDRLLWVDAVCINQTHKMERSHQVRLMGTVYSRASGVIIWLGPESPDSAQALQDLEELSQDKHLWELDFYGKLANDSRNWIPAPANRVDPLENLLKRTYWSRIWMVQEIVRARNATVFVGPHSIPWDTCVRVRDNWPKHSRKCCNTECGIMDPRMRRVMNWINSSWGRYQEKEGDLLSRLNFLRGLDASDPRDKIFAILGMVEDKSTFLDPDYESEYPIVFRNWAARMISTSGDLDVFLHVKLSLKQEGFPSWVPDWSKYESSVRFQAERLEHHRHISRSFKADGCTNVSPTFLRMGNRLRLAGCILDKAKEAGGSLAYDRKDQLTDDQNQVGAIKAWNSVLESWAHVAKLASLDNLNYPGGGTCDDAYWRTLLSDHVTEVGTYLGDRISADDKARYERWRLWFDGLVKQPDSMKTAYYKDTLAEDRDLDRFDWTIINMNYNRKFSRLPMNASEWGRSIWTWVTSLCFLCGGRTPFVVRQSCKEKDMYEIIGYAYVHGVMDGECAPPKEQWSQYWFG